MISELNPYLPPQAPPPPGGLNPWVSMWTQPRATIRQIVAEDPEKMVLALILLSSLPSVLTEAFQWSPGDDLSTTLTRAVTVGAVVLFTVFGLFIGARLLRWTGEWLGGEATSKEVRAAIAWSNIPTIWTLPLVALGIAIEHQDLFMTATLGSPVSMALAFLSIALKCVQGVVGVWGTVIFLHALGEVQGFSAWKALGNSLLAGLICLGPFLALGGLIIAFAS